jgi:hypothetical protein
MIPHQKNPVLISRVYEEWTGGGKVQGPGGGGGQGLVAKAGGGKGVEPGVILSEEGWG